MKKLTLRWPKTIFTRIVMLFGIFFLPLILIAVLMYQNALATLEQNTLASVESRGEDFLDNFEQHIERIKMLQMDLLSDEDLWDLALNPNKGSDYSNLLAMRRIQQRLRSAMVGSYYVEDFRAHLFPLQKTISAVRGFEVLNTLFNPNVIVPVGVYGAQLVKADNRYSFTARRENQTQLMFDVEVVIDVMQVEHSLYQIVTDTNTTAFLLFGDDLTIISSAGDEKLITTLGEGGIFRQDLPLNRNNICQINQERYLFSQQYSKYLDMYVVQLIPYKQLLTPLKPFYNVLWGYIGLVFILMMIFVFLATRYFQKPMNEMLTAFRKAEVGDLKVQVAPQGDTEFDYLGKQFNAMVKSIRVLVEKNYQQEIMIKNAELKQLQAQINPHFLYNSFYILARLIKLEDLERAKHLASELGKYFRYVTYNALDEVPLSDEWEHAATYAEIMTIRFGKKISINIGSLPEQAVNIKVPRLILQPLLENTFEHGIRDMDEGAFVSMSAKCMNGEIIIEVVDNGIGLTQEIAANILQIGNSGRYNEVTGLANINRRLQLKFGEQFGLLVENTNHQGTKIIVKIPITTEICGAR